MIPTKLVLRNFMCYRDEVALDFRTIRIACISGDNGAGKSALLDAITWALWGKTRAPAERDLISLGTTEMAVDYQFLLGHQEYRVLRRRRRRGKSPDQAQIEVQVRDVTPDGDSPWRAITGDTLAQTQALLTAAIGMEYDTFINSAFILQGRADEFTTRGPTDRKQVLADILGLGRYDALEERARALRRARELERRDADGELERIARELEGRPALDEELREVSEGLLAAQREALRLGEELEGARARRAALETREAQAREAEGRRDAHAREAERLRARIEHGRGRVARLEAIIAEADRILAGHGELLAARERQQALDGALSRVRALEGRGALLDRQITSTRQRLLQEQHGIEHELTQLRQRAERLGDLQGRHAALQERLAGLDATLELRPILTESITSATEEMGGRKARNEHLLAEMKRLKGLQRQVDAAEGACPLCRRPLIAGDHQAIHDQYETEGKSLAEQHRANKARIGDLERELADCDRRLREVEGAQRERQALTRQFGQVERDLHDAREAGALIVARSAERQGFEDRIARGDYALEAQRELAELGAAIAALAYDEADHTRVRERVAALHDFDRRMHELSSAQAAIGELRDQVAEDAGALAAREADRAAEAARAAELRAGTAELPALIRRCEDLAVALDGRVREQSELTLRQGSLTASLGRLADREEEGRRLRAERARLVEEEGAYRDLALAFGKSGIQAMIIEAAVPELQDEANAILANMPGNGMRVEFRTQRETQKGDTVEALDIVIGDEAGQRNYALYSGGEAFRINFAIRVALSKLLARRAGAKLQTLVIDEGFGTQDARGRDSIVEAIRAIEGDFATILIITHVNELKEAFPTHLLVEKTVAGSRIAVN